MPILALISYSFGIIFMVLVQTHISSCQEEKLLTYDLSENLGQFTYVGDIATDSSVQDEVPEQEVSQLEFAVLTPATDAAGVEFFTVDSNTGILRTNKEIDRDIECPHQLTCALVIRIAVVSKLVSSNFFKIILVTVNIIDLNDNPPKFVETSIKKAVPENTPIYSSISIPVANDPDSPQFGISNYSIVSSVPEFSIKPVSNSAGESVALYLVVTEELDRERQDFYILVVSAFDKGELTGTLTVNIDILDVNDNQPIFNPPQYITSIDEDAKSGSTVTTVIAMDIDLASNAEIVYAFDVKTEADFGAQFNINNKSGAITLTKALDYELQDMYNLVVTAREVFHETIPAEAQVLINVNDINDNPPVITTSALSNTGNVEVDENAPVGTFIVLLEVTDPDTGNGGKFSCILQSNINNRFRLDYINPQRTEFKISTNYIFDRENTDQYTLMFECLDQGVPQQTSTAEIQVSIQDQNDNAPKFTQLIYEVDVRENNNIGMFLTQVKAFDPDFGVNGEVEYALYTEAMTYIHVDIESGNITAREIFDYEKYHSLSFGIVAKDKGVDSHQTTAILNIKIFNENDEPPHFTTTHFQLAVNESRPEFTNIGQVTIMERDINHNNVTFSLTSGSNYLDLFGITSNTGVIYTKQIFDVDDRNSESNFQLEVKVADSMFDNLYSVAIVSVNVLDLNDNPPVLSFSNTVNNSISVASDTEKGQVLTTITAEDIDSGQNAEAVFHIESGNDGQYFALSESSGELRTVRSLQHINQRTFTLVISATDRGNPPLVDVATLHIVVNSSLSRSVQENTLDGTKNLTIVTVVAVISAVLIIILIISILILQRKDKFRLKQKQISKLLYDPKEIIMQDIVTVGTTATKTSSFDSINKESGGSYIREVDTNDEYPADYQIGYPLDQNYRMEAEIDEEDKEMFDQSRADSGRGSNDEQEITTSHKSKPQVMQTNRRHMLLYGKPTSTSTKENNSFQQDTSYPKSSYNDRNGRSQSSTCYNNNSHDKHVSSGNHPQVSICNTSKRQEVNNTVSSKDNALFILNPSSSYI